MCTEQAFQGFGLTQKEPENWSTLSKIEFLPKTFDVNDIDIKIEACGLCASDIHTLKADWSKNYFYPLVVGHEVIGKVTKVGSNVKTLKVGDRVGVGAQAFSCLDCELCKSDNEPYCPKSVFTYNSRYPDGRNGFGGYASDIRVHEHFAFKIPDNLPSESTAPMLCAGITVFSPLVRAKVGPGSKVGIIGIGGLGHFGILFAKALGAEVYAFSRNDSKKEDCLALGVDHYIATGNDPNWFEPYQYKLDLIVCTANSTENFNLSSYLATLTIGGKFVNVGLPTQGNFDINARSFMKNACFMGASLLGSRKEIEYMLQLASENNIHGWVETIPISIENCKKALERTDKNDIRFRFTFVDYDKAFGN
ncbi:NAD(P)-dependent alcohol dehydrogenase [Ascoidea rubescens DSM 1968]|uniref:alcohol dehydrogenase (NADP(+)) n=1 Tax=Ascoidea rubescens DSM 1968 TaxID=1344418 RepID=A0A1D2VNI3_9ASCO|nr:NADPH-dependent alcohol dehydrogenase [Ascoidea rubescens DSM 1968]ODV63156.1 NADPH-dependent alcohol dehydrogenase [Ascoidea rubescens DSM 1968]